MPVKGWIQRFALVLLVVVAVGLMILGKAGSPVVERLRMTITDAVAPVLDVMSRPVTTVAHAVEEGRQLLYLRSENARLRKENERLHHWQVVARRLEQENAALRELLNFAGEPRPTFITARVIADSGGAFVRTRLLNAGARDGVHDGQAVVNSDGLVGRVVETGERSARTLLLTDFNARIPVVVSSARVPAIVAGDNTDRPRLNFLPDNAQVAAGDRVVTSGRGGMLPPGLPVGVVIGGVKNGVVRVEPFVDWHRLEYVRVIDYVLPGVLPQTRPAGRAGRLP